MTHSLNKENIYKLVNLKLFGTVRRAAVNDLLYTYRFRNPGLPFLIPTRKME